MNHFDPSRTGAASSPTRGRTSAPARRGRRERDGGRRKLSKAVALFLPHAISGLLRRFISPLDAMVFSTDPETSPKNVPDLPDLGFSELQIVCCGQLLTPARKRSASHSPQLR